MKTGWIVEFYVHAPMVPVAWFASLDHARSFVAAHGGLAACYLHPANERNEEAEALSVKLTEAEESVEKESRASYGAGYDDGHADGVSEGRGEMEAKLAELRNNVTAEREKSYVEGHGNGYQTGRNDGYKEGFENGFESGHKDGDNAGYERGCFESVRRLLIAKQSIESVKSELERVAGELL